MEYKAKSIRPFIGSKDFEISRNFYRDLGFTECILDNSISYFKTGAFGFYLQNAFVEDWINNTMVFMEVADTKKCWEDLQALELDKKYERVKLTPIREFPWGRECYLHDPSGILWHFGEFNNK